MRFKNFLLLLEEANKHSTHLEELFITRGKEGLQNCITGIKSIVDSLGSTNLPISLKIDGCVHEDTLVVTKDGPKPISLLTQEDIVKCYNVDTQKIK